MWMLQTCFEGSRRPWDNGRQTQCMLGQPCRSHIDSCCLRNGRNFNCTGGKSLVSCKLLPWDQQMLERGCHRLWYGHARPKMIRTVDSRWQLWISLTLDLWKYWGNTIFLLYRCTTSAVSWSSWTRDGIDACHFADPWTGYDRIVPADSPYFALTLVLQSWLVVSRCITSTLK